MRKLIFAALMAFVFLALAGPASATAPPGLNDTGQTQCYDENDAVADCATVAADDGERPRQDARFGRDAQAGAGELTKTGAGAAGFDFAPLDAIGDPIALTGGVPTSTPSCVLDNVTDLVWEVKTDGNMGTTYTFYAAATYASDTNTT